MKRRTYTARIVINGERVIDKTTYAWNSGIRTTETLVREYARETRTLYIGDKPAVADPTARERTYLRHWTSADGQTTITAAVWEVIA
jgi:hypothetical protein